MPLASKPISVKFQAKHVATYYPKAPIVLGSPGNEYGITRWEVIDVEEGNPKTNNKQELTLKGNFFAPVERGKTYTVFAEEDHSDQYGTFYKIIYINLNVDLTKINNQKAILKEIVTEKQMENLYSLYEYPLNFIMAHDIDALKKVKGITYDKAIKIINKFESLRDLSEIFAELDGYGLSPKIIAKLQQRYNSNQKVIDIVKNNPYQLIKDIDGISFKRADAIAMKGKNDPYSVNRVKAFIEFFLEEQANDKGDSYVTAKELNIDIITYFGGKEEIYKEYYDEEGNVVGSNIAQAIQELQEEELIVVEDSENRKLRRVYLKKLYDLENDIAFHLKRLLNSANNFSYTTWEGRVKQLEQVQGFEFDKTQIEGIKLGLDKQVCLICGAAGVGKSSLVSGIIAGLNTTNFAQCALSGKAAARLQEVTGVEGSTIHRLLGYKNGHFTFDEHNPLPYHMIILDEISLVGGEIFLSLLRAIADGTKLIMLGDFSQLSSIGSLNLAYDIYKSPLIPTVELTTIHRQAARSGIITTAHEVRQQHQLYPLNYEGIDIRGELKDMTVEVTNNIELVKSKAMDWFKKEYESELVNKDIMRIQMIAPVKERGNACVYNFNNEIQAYVNPITGADSILITNSKDYPYKIHKGDKVMCMKNNYDAMGEGGATRAIFNGWTGIVKAVSENSICIDFPLAKELIFLPLADARENLALGYASTIHKLQGSDYPAIIGAINNSTPPTMLTCQLLYTLITRAKQECILVGQGESIRKCIVNNFVSSKRTFLQELLLKGGN